MIRKLLRPWIFITWIALSAGLIIILVLVFNQSGAEFSPPPVVTAAMTVIPAPVTATPTSTPTVMVSPTPTREDIPPDNSDTISIGGYVEIFGTEGDGLRIRSEPGTGSQVLLLGLESEVFQVIEGPTQADEYVWWRIQAPYDETIQGWAASNYLRTIEDQ